MTDTLATDATPLHDAAPLLNIVTDAKGLRELRHEWQEIIDHHDAPSLFLSWEWISTWHAHFGHRCSLIVLVFRDPADRCLLGVAPLAIYTERIIGLIPIQSLGFAGRDLAPDHMDLLVRSGQEQIVTEAFVNWLRGGHWPWDVLLLNSLSAEARLLSYLRDRTLFAWHHQHEVPCPALALPKDIPSWLASLSKKRRYKMRRTERALRNACSGQVELTQVTTERQLEQGLSTLIRLHQAARHSRHTANAFPGRVYVECHRVLCSLLLEKGWLRLFSLTAAGQPIAAALCYRYRDTVYFYSTGYDTAFGQFSPGMMLLTKIIEESISEGATRFDFLRGDEPYKQVFAREVLREVQIRVPCSRVGTLMTRIYHLGRAHIRPFLRSLVSKRR